MVDLRQLLRARRHIEGKIPSGLELGAILTDGFYRDFGGVECDVVFDRGDGFMRCLIRPSDVFLTSTFSDQMKIGGVAFVGAVGCFI